MRASHILCILIPLLTSSIGASLSLGEVTRSKEEVVREFHPFNQNEMERLAGLFENNIPEKRVTAPFAANPETSDPGSGQLMSLFEKLSELGFSYDEKAPNHSVAYDGEQLIVWAKPETQRKLRAFLNHFREPNQLRISYWIERESKAEQKQSPDIHRTPSSSVLTLFRKQANLHSELNGIKLSVTPDREKNDWNEIISRISLTLNNGIRLELDSEYMLRTSSKTEIGAIRFETAGSDKITTGTETYRIYCQAERIGPGGDVRPFNDSIIERLNLPQTYQHETVLFALDRDAGIRLCGPDFQSAPDKALEAYFRTQGITFEPEKKTFIQYDNKSNELSVRHTPKALAAARDIISEHTKPLNTSSRLELKHQLAKGGQAVTQTIEMKLRSRSGKRTSLKLSDRSHDTIGDIAYTSTTNLERDRLFETIHTLQTSGSELLPSLNAKFEALAIDGKAVELLSFERTLDDNSSKESLQLTGSAESPQYSATDKNTHSLITKFYPVRQSATIRLFGTAEKFKLDPFKETNSEDPLEHESKALISFFQNWGIDFANAPGADLAYDGERLIIRQTEAAHRRISKTLRERPRPAYHSTTEFINGDGITAGSLSIYCISGKRSQYDLSWEDSSAPDLSVKLILNAETRSITSNMLELKTTPSLFSTLPALNLSSEFETTSGMPTEIATLPTEDGKPFKLISTVTSVDHKAE